MRRSLALLVAVCLVAGPLAGQQPSIAPPAKTTGVTGNPRPNDPTLSESPPRKRNWVGRMLHPFSSAPASSQYKDPKLRGLSLVLQVLPQTVKLSETRQLGIKVRLTNESKKAIELSFPNDQRIEIYLRNSAEAILTKWSDNHAISDKPAVVLINPQEHIEYNETISTRELSPDKVFIAEVFFPKYPELRARQKFLTAP